MQEHGYVYELFRRLGLSDFAASTAEFVLVRPLKIALILLVALLVARGGGRFARRFVRGVHARTPLKATSPRAEQRAATVGDALASLWRALVLAVAALMALAEVGVELAPLLAGAGIAGLAIGFGAQSLVKDLISGLFILAEDQYGVGDSVNLGEPQVGTVEDVTLRVTRIRASDGTVWFVPNGEIRRVGNSSMEWSKAVVDVLVEKSRPLEEALAAATATAKAFAEDVDWSDVLLEPPVVLGAQAMGAEGVTVRVEAKTAPREQAAVARELRRRLAAGLAAPAPVPSPPRRRRT